jgi:hypothetical protein
MIERSGKRKGKRERQLERRNLGGEVIQAREP